MYIRRNTECLNKFCCLFKKAYSSEQWKTLEYILVWIYFIYWSTSKYL